jgi:hypothetical protein
LGGSFVSIYSSKVELFITELDLILRHENREQPEGTVFNEMAWDLDSILDEIVLSVELFDIGEHGLTGLVSADSKHYLNEWYL